MVALCTTASKCNNKIEKDTIRLGGGMGERRRRRRVPCIDRQFITNSFHFVRCWGFSLALSTDSFLLFFILTLWDDLVILVRSDQLTFLPMRTNNKTSRIRLNQEITTSLNGMCHLYGDFIDTLHKTPCAHLNYEYCH